MKKLKFSSITIPLFLPLLISSVFSCSNKISKSVNIKNDTINKANSDVKADIAPKKLKGLVLLIDFSDAPANVDLKRADSIINGLNYTEATVTSSVRKYWQTQSRGKIDITHDVVSYFRAPKTAAWYKQQNWTIFLELSKQALEWLKLENPNYNWGSLSTSTDIGEEGTFLSMNFFTTVDIAGSGGTHRIDDWTAPNGTPLGQITAQGFIDSWDTNINLFSINHEMGHSVWGVPDTYDHDGSSSGTGHYSVMSGNQANGQVEAFGAPFLAFQKWVDVVDIQSNKTYIAPEDGNTIFRLTNPSDPKEYFLIEARKKSTLGNEMIPANRGLLIWHVDENVKTSNDDERMLPNGHYAHAIVQADGKFDLERGINKADATDYFMEGSTLSQTTIPNSKWWNGKASKLDIRNIKFLPDNKISFCNGNCP